MALKEDVLESLNVQAYIMAQQELEARLVELDMTSADAESHGARLTSVQAQNTQLRDLLERACMRAYILMRDSEERGCAQTCPPARRSAYRCSARRTMGWTTRASRRASLAN